LNKLLGISVIAMTLIAAGLADVNGSGEVAFQVSIEADATISVTLNENTTFGTTGKLEFSPAITAFGDPDAIADDSIATETLGDYSIDNNGNVAIELEFSLNADMPTGIYTRIGGNQTYGGSWTADLDSALPHVRPSWASGITKGSTQEVWQQVSADASADGSQLTFDRSVVITAYPVV